MEIRSEKIQIVPIDSIEYHPQNPHSHSDDQIDRLIKLIEYQGFRNPLIVDQETNYVVAGNGRLQALQKMGAKKVPVIYQKFENQDQVYAYLVSDNAIGKNQWAELDFGSIDAEIGNLGPDFDVDFLGLKDFKLDASEIDAPDLPYGDKSELEQITFTLESQQAETVREAVALCKEKYPGAFENQLNNNNNGNAIAYICELFITDGQG